jgi:hypothetical protein
MYGETRRELPVRDPYGGAVLDCSKVDCHKGLHFLRELFAMFMECMRYSNKIFASLYLFHVRFIRDLSVGLYQFCTCRCTSL